MGRAGSMEWNEMEESGSSATGRVCAGRKRKSGLPSSTRTGTSSDSSSGIINNRALEGVDAPVAPSPPSAREAGGTRARSGAAIAADRYSSEPDALVKTEARVKISCKADPRRLKVDRCVGEAGR